MPDFWFQKNMPRNVFHNVQDLSSVIGSKLRIGIDLLHQLLDQPFTRLPKPQIIATEIGFMHYDPGFRKTNIRHRAYRLNIRTNSLVSQHQLILTASAQAFRDAVSDFNRFRWNIQKSTGFSSLRRTTLH
jgi:hypothetical protein